MSSNITPQQAFEAAKVLWPNCAYIYHHLHEGGSIICSEQGALALIKRQVDWPEGFDRWPPPEQKWRSAEMLKDWGKPARFKNSGIDEWKMGVILGRYPNGTKTWYDTDGDEWDYCEVVEETPTSFADTVTTLAQALEKDIPGAQEDWQPAIIDDFNKERWARFRDSNAWEWRYGTISGYTRGSIYQWQEAVSQDWFKQCEVNRADQS